MSYSYRVIIDESDPARETVRRLIGTAFGGALGPDYWDWKYRGNARRPLIQVAESDGEVAGCRHGLVFDFRLEEGLTAGLLLGADLLVGREHRGHGVARRLVADGLELGIEQNPDVDAFIGFTYPGVADNVVRPLTGYMEVPNSTRRWSKIVGWDGRIDHLHSSGFLDRAAEKGGVAGCDHTMRLEIEGAPPVWVSIRAGRVAVSASPPASHQVRVSLRRDGIEALKSRSPAQLLAALADGGIRVRGRPRYLREVLSARRVYSALLQEILRKPSVSDR
jgi:GNAT superfamily N-acetyltransferase